jgi:hypothetical protein
MMKFTFKRKEIKRTDRQTDLPAVAFFVQAPHNRLLLSVALKDDLAFSLEKPERRMMERKRPKKQGIETKAGAGVGEIKAGAGDGETQAGAGE